MVHEVTSDCAGCAGAGATPVYSCVWKLVGYRETVVCSSVARAEVGMDRSWQGWGEWPITFEIAFQIVCAARARIMRTAQEKDAAEAERRRKRHGR